MMRWGVIIDRSFPPSILRTIDHGNNGHTNMKVAGYLGMASNIGFGAKGALDVVAGYRAGDAKAWKSWPLLLVLPFNLAADYLTTISTPRFVYSLDDVATETAALINQKMKERPQDGTNATHQIYVLSELLAKHPRITQNSHQLREAIAGRLRIDYGYDLPNEGDGVKEYLHLSEVSPFAGPKKLDTEQVENTGSFLEKLKTERLAPPTVVARR